MIGCRNDRKLGVLNGQRGTITHTDPDARGLEVALDGGQRVSLSAEYLDAGHLDHGYAITAHRAQGATFYRTFVLGSEELYREWGYTALSRHRQQARFSVAGADLHTDPELPPQTDPLIFGISDLLQRTQAKGLAIDELPAADRQQLEAEREALRTTLGRDQPPRRVPALERRELEGLVQSSERARRERERLTEERKQIGWRRRRERDLLDQRLGRNAQDQAQLDARFEAARTTRLDADATDERWLATHSPDAQRLLAVTDELRVRDRTAARIEHQLDDHHRHPLPDHGRHLEQDLGMDLGF